MTRGERSRAGSWRLSLIAVGFTLALTATSPAAAEETIIFFHQDALGSVRLVTGNNGEVLARHDYLPFGEELPADQFGRASSAGYGGTDGVPQRFTGKERDPESNLDYFGARYYSGAMGRFTSPDKAFADQSAGDPGSWNLYCYARNSPWRYIDPRGMEVVNVNLSAAQESTLIEDWKRKTGFKSMSFKDGKLTVDQKAGFSGGSERARALLLAAATSQTDDFLISAVDSDAVAFGSVDGGTVYKDRGKTEYAVSVDFRDFNRLNGPDTAKASFSVGFTLLHEFAHKLHGLGDQPNSSTPPYAAGPVEAGYINPMRRELGLPERLHYTAVPVPEAQRKVYQGGGSELRFGDADNPQVLRWRTSLVGGVIR